MQNGFRSLALAALATFALLMGGCSTIKYTVDDGRKVDEKLLANIRAYGKGQQAIVPAIVRTAKLEDKDCDTQWELPFAVATSYDLTPDDKVAWVRGLNVDERLSVVSATKESGLVAGDKLASVYGVKSENSKDMFTLLMDVRDRGGAFEVITATGKRVSIKPFKVCRGHVLLAPPNVPEAQDYHWEMSVHPLETVRNDLSSDEALWMVLWTQGLSEEGGARMKTYQYGKNIVSAAFNLFSLATGAGAIAGAASKAAAAAATTVARDAIIKEAATNMAINYAQKQVQDAVIDAVKDKAIELAKDAAKATAKQQMLTALHEAAANRSGLSGVAWVAGTVFDKADQWAFERMVKLNADPLSGFRLHYKLMQEGYGRNAFLFDSERLPLVTAQAKKIGRDYEIASILGGYVPGTLELDMGDIRQASVDAPMLMPSDFVEPAKAEGYNLGGFISAMSETPATPATSSSK